MRPYKPGEDLFNLLQRKLPDFVQSEFPIFVEFVNTFAHYLESPRTFSNTTVSTQYGAVANNIVQTTIEPGGSSYELRKLLEYRDIQTTLDEFTSHFLNMYARSFPRHTHISADLLLYSLRSFYQSKGTTDAVRWFFRTVFNEDADVYFPRQDILRASDGDWVAPITIKVSAPVQNPITLVTNPNSDVQQFYVGQRIQTATGSALVEGVVTTIVGQSFNQHITVNELTLRADTILGVFQPGQLVNNIDSDEQVYTLVLPVISGVQINSGGSNYTPGDIITFSEGPTGGQGYGAAGEVAAVASTSLNGVTIVDGGDGYYTGLPVVFTSSSGHGATAIVSQVIFGNIVLEDGSGYFELENSSSGTTYFVLEDRNTIPLDLLITNFVDSQNATCFDDTSNAKNGTYSNVLLGVAGAFFGSEAAQFNGANAEITFASEAASTTTYSLEFWIKPDSTQSSALGAIWADASSHGVFYQPSTKKIWLTGGFVNNTALSDGVWYYITIVVSGSSGTFYVNGTADGTFVTAPTFTPASIGDDPAGDLLKGTLDELAWYAGVALTTTQISNHFGATHDEVTYSNTILGDSPSAYYKFNDIGVFLNAADYGVSGDDIDLDGTDIDTAIEVFLASGTEKPFMVPWVWTDALHTTAELANAQSTTLPVNPAALFVNGIVVFSLNNPTDNVTNSTNATLFANVIVSDTTSNVGFDILYLKQFANVSQFAIGQTWKQTGNGVAQPGTVTTNGSTIIVGTNTNFTALTTNSHIRLADGSQHCVKVVSNSTSLQTYAPTNVTLTNNTYSLIPVGTILDITLQAQRFYGKIQTIELLTSGENYLTAPFVSSYSMSADVQSLFFLNPDPSGNIANGTIEASNGQINVWQAATLTAEQDTGQITQVTILASGVNYLDANSIVITAIHSLGSGKNADLSPILGALTQYPGTFTSSNGWLSADKFLESGDYYNDFTYVVRVAESFNRYKTLLLKLLHPAGFQPLGEFVEVQPAATPASNSETFMFRTDTYAEHVENDGASHFWELNDSPSTSNVAFDAVGHANGVVSANGVTFLVPGALADSTTAATFANTSNGEITATITGGLTNTFSIECWFKSTATAEGHIIETGDCSLYLLNGSVIFNSNSVNVTSASATLNNNSWHNATVTYNGTTLKLYVDGALTNSASLTMGTANQNVYMGESHAGGALYFNGTLDELAIYPLVLTSTQILDHWTMRTFVPGTAI